MTYSIEFKPAAKRQLVKLHKAMALRLQTKIDVLLEDSVSKKAPKFFSQGAFLCFFYLNPDLRLFRIKTNH